MVQVQLILRVLYLYVVVTCIKLLLIPSYKSTDFDVHRNWLALTKHVPLSQWYTDDFQGQTKHTLDYPPLFAFFEYALSTNPFTQYLVQHGYVSKSCLEQVPDSYQDHPNQSQISLQDRIDSWTCTIFHRCTVIFVGDFIFWMGAWLFSNLAVVVYRWEILPPDNKIHFHSSHPSFLVFRLIVLNPGILLLDHVHFQYNGMLLGLFLMSLYFLLQGFYENSSIKKKKQNPKKKNMKTKNIFYHYFLSWDLLGALFYILLVSMKHLYLLLAPFYFMYLLRHFCFPMTTIHHENTQDKKNHSNNTFPFLFTFSFSRFFLLAITTLIFLFLPFVPFLRLDSSLITKKVGLQDNPETYMAFVSQQFHAIYQRLFPFQRGLCHSYWAGNIWALYLFMDKMLHYVFSTRIFMIRRPFWNHKNPPSVLASSITSRIHDSTKILPNIPPMVTGICLVLFLIPTMKCSWDVASMSLYDEYHSNHPTNQEKGHDKKDENPMNHASPTNRSDTIYTSTSMDHDRTFCSKSEYFFLIIVYTCLTGFLFSYHVHEKAIMTTILPMSILAVTSMDNARLFLRLCIYGHFGLLPLLHRPVELGLKVVLHYLYILWVIYELEYYFLTEGVVEKEKDRNESSEKEIQSKWDASPSCHGNDIAKKKDLVGCRNHVLLTTAEWMSILSTSLVLLFSEVIFPLFFKHTSKYEFVPLMMTSVVCALGIVSCWIEVGYRLYHFTSDKARRR